MTKTTLEVRVPLDKNGLPPKEGCHYTLQLLLRALPHAVVAGVPSVERAIVTPLGADAPGRCVRRGRGPRAAKPGRLLDEEPIRSLRTSAASRVIELAV